MDTLSESRLRNLGEFFCVLHARGWTVTIEHHSRLAQLLARVGPDLAPSALKRLLCPIFATDAGQQQAFGAAYDDYFQPVPLIPPDQIAPDEPTAELRPPAVSRRKRSLVLAGAAALALVLAGNAIRTSFVDPGATNRPIPSPPAPTRQVPSNSSTGLRIVTPESDAATPLAQDAAASAITPAATPATISPGPPGPFQECMIQGRLFRERRLHATAITTFRVAATLAPDNPAPLAEIAATYEEMKLRDSARQEWQKIYNLGPTQAGVYRELAGVMLNISGSLALGVKDHKPHSPTPVQDSARPADDSVPQSQRPPPPSTPSAPK